MAGGPIIQEFQESIEFQNAAKKFLSIVLRYQGKINI